MSNLPVPKGYKLLCSYIAPEATYASGIIKADTTMNAETLTAVVLRVEAMGPECYADKAKFPSGSWCEVGDFIMCRAYSGSRFKIDGRPYVLLNDDMVEAVVDSPKGITRA